MSSVAERVRRVRGAATGRLHSVPILALMVHGACNCRCVMCDIWRANASARTIDDDVLATHVAAIRRLRVRRVMLTGGEPLLHRNLWALCDRLRAEGIALTLVTTGLVAARDAAAIAARIDTVVVSLDGPPEVHDAIRRVPQAFAKLAAGVAALAGASPRPRLIARTVLQRANHTAIAPTIAAAQALGVDELSFLPADLTSTAFNRPVVWSDGRVADVAVAASELPALASAIADAARECAPAFRDGFVVGGVASLHRIHAYYRAAAGLGPYPAVRCNAPWVSAVLDANGDVRPCFFLPAYPAAASLDATINGAGAVAARRKLDVATDETCRRCVCSLHLAPGADV